MDYLGTRLTKPSEGLEDSWAALPLMHLNLSCLKAPKRSADQKKCLKILLKTCFIGTFIPLAWTCREHQKKVLHHRSPVLKLLNQSLTVACFKVMLPNNRNTCALIKNKMIKK